MHDLIVGEKDRQAKIILAKHFLCYFHFYYFKWRYLLYNIYIYIYIYINFIIIEFNSLYDSGVKFGLVNDNPRVEGVMVSGLVLLNITMKLKMVVMRHGLWKSLKHPKTGYKVNNG
jgi:hypothetical protein